MITKQEESVGYLFSIEIKGGVGSGILGHVTLRRESISNTIKKYQDRFLKEKEGKSDSTQMRLAEEYSKIFDELEGTLKRQDDPPKHNLILYHGTDLKSASQIFRQGLKAGIDKGEKGDVSWATSDLKLATQYSEEVGAGKRAIVVVSDYKRAGFYKGGSDPKDYHNYSDTPVEHIKEILFSRNGKLYTVANPKWGGLKKKSLSYFWINQKEIF